MKLFELDRESYAVVYEPQTLTIKAFADIFKRDRSKGKTKAVRELSFVYFYCDIKSDYMIHIDPKVRLKAIKADLLLGDTWKIDKVMEAAIEFYESMSTSITAEILADSRFTAKTLSNKMKEAVQEEDLTIDEMSKLMANITKIPVVVKALQAAEQAVLKEIEEAKGSIGSKEKAIFEDGL